MAKNIEGIDELELMIVSTPCVHLNITLSCFTTTEVNDVLIC